MTIKDGIRFGIGFVIGKTIVYTVAEIGLKYCEEALDRINVKEESDEDRGKAAAE